MTGVYAALSVMGALRYRDQTGKGQTIDLALLDVAVFSLSYTGLNYLASGQVPPRVGNASPVIAPSGTYQAADAMIVLMVGNDGQFARFCAALGVPDLASDPRYRSSLLRVQNKAALDTVICPIFASQSAVHWVDSLEAAGVPCGRINDMSTVFEDPQVKARGAVEKVTHPVMGELPMLANPMHMSESPVRYEVPPPMLGEHTDEVLGSLLGKSAQQLAELKARGIV